VGILLNEKVDLLAKRAAVEGELWHNNPSYGEVLSTLKPIYDIIDSEVFMAKSEKAGSYYLKNLKSLNIQSALRFTRNRSECQILSRIITGYSGTNLQLYKRRLIDSPNCSCDEASQDPNHIYWACPILEFEREKLILLLRGLKLFNPFSIEYLLGNINKKISAILVKFAMVANEKLNISL